MMDNFKICELEDITNPDPGSSSSRLENETQHELDQETELTNKFLSGEMSFTDYSLEWYDKEGDIDDDESITPVPKNIVLNKNPKSKRRKITRLSPNLLGLMGEANLRCVRGETEIAEKMCYEIIRQVPRAAEPYQTLALIYENDTEKSLQFSLFAAHLSPSDAEEWLRLANISKQRNDIRQEIMCLTQAIRASPESLEIHLRRLELLQSLETTNLTSCFKMSAVRCYHKIVNSMPSTQGEVVMEYAKKAAKLYYNDKEFERALQVMNAAFKKCSSLFQMEDMNLYLELLIIEKEYHECIEVFVANIGVELEAEVQIISNNGAIEEHTNYLNCKIPEEVPIDIRSKLLICFIYLKAYNLVNSLLEEFLKNDVSKAPDLYMDIEEALTSVGEHESAMKLLTPLINCGDFDLGAVWLKHADCLFKLGRDEEAVSSYYKVIKHAPQHVYARQKLYEILERKGYIDEALEALQQDYRLVVSGRLLYEQCNALHKHNKMVKYLEVGEALLGKTFVKFKHQEELKIARLSRSSIDLIQNFRNSCGDNIYHPNDLQFDEEEQFSLSPDEEWSLFTELLKVAFEHKKYYIMQRLSFGALLSKNLNQITPHHMDIEFFALQACLLNKDYRNAFPIARELVTKNLNKNQVWNLFNLVVYDGHNYGKFLVRLFQKEENHKLKNLFFGNNYLISGRYLIALKYFLNYHEVNKDPLTALLISITLLIMAAQRTVDKHQNLIIQGFSYLLIYQKLRKWDHESYYNMGRACQMLHLNNLAIDYYEKSLACAETINCDVHGSIDLQRETAYNLYVLYKDQSPHVARMYLQNYIVI